MFLGSTNDGHTFAVLNSDKHRYLRSAHRVLTKAGFAPVNHRGRVIYLLPPTDTLHQAGQAMYELCSHTADMADLAWTARPRHPDPHVRVRFTGDKVTITADSLPAQDALRQFRSVTENEHGDFFLPDNLTERQKVHATIRIGLRLDRLDITSHIDLGIATPDDIPPVPPHRPSLVASLPSVRLSPIQRTAIRALSRSSAKLYESLVSGKRRVVTEDGTRIIPATLEFLRAHGLVHIDSGTSLFHGQRIILTRAGREAAEALGPTQSAAATQAAPAAAPSAARRR